MKTKLLSNSLVVAIVTLMLNTYAQAADRSVIPRVRAGVPEVIDLRLNLAAGLIKALDANIECDVNAYPSSIIEQVHESWSMATDLQKSAFLRKVPAQSIIRKDLAFRIALGDVDLGREASLENFSRAITGTRFFRFGSGAFGSRYNVTLSRSGVAREHTMEFDEDTSVRWHSSKVTWAAELSKSGRNPQFSIKIGNTIYEIDRGTAGEVRLIPQGVKQDTPEYFQRVLTSTDAYCSA